jgi:hypothetical protein
VFVFEGEMAEDKDVEVKGLLASVDEVEVLDMMLLLPCWLTCFAWHACTSEVSVSTVVSIRYQKK